MGQQFAGESRRASLSWFAGRAAVLAALGTGLWLAGQATASAQELSPPPTAAETVSSTFEAVAAPSVELLAPATSAVDPAPDRTASSSVARAAEPAPAVVASVAPVPVVPVVSAAAPAMHSAVVPATHLAGPIAEAAEPVLEVAAPIQDVAAPVMAAVEQAIPSVAHAAVTLAGALAAVLAPVANALDPLLSIGLIGPQERPDTDSRGLNEVVHGPAAGPAGASRVLTPAGDDVDPAAGAGGGAGEPGPVPPYIPVTGGPARAVATGADSFDQSPADLSAAVLATITAGLAATGDARDAAGNIAFDPSFSPD